MNAIVEMEPQQLQVAPRAGSDSQVMMRLIEAAMAKPDFDMVKLERLLEVKERWDAAEAKKAFAAALTAFKAEPVEIFKRKEVGYKTKEGDFVGYKHAELSDVTDAIGPAMAKHQLSFRWDIHQNSGSITVDCIVMHVMGHSEKVTMTGQPDNSGKKNAIQQQASTITYLQRYTLLAATGMSTKGEDDDGAGGAEPGQPGQQQAGRQEVGMCTPERFEKNRAAWRELILNKQKTVSQLIAQIETKGKLTEDQKLTIHSWSREND